MVVLHITGRFIVSILPLLETMCLMYGAANVSGTVMSLENSTSMKDGLDFHRRSGTFLTSWTIRSSVRVTVCE